MNPATLKYGELAKGTKIGETKGVFPRIEKAKTMSEIENEKLKIESCDSHPFLFQFSIFNFSFAAPQR